MSIMKLCPRCRSKHEYGQRCPKGCYEREKRENNALYDKYQRKNSGLYNSKEWEVLRKVCRNTFDSLCVWSYCRNGKIVPGTLAHHIIEVEEDCSRSLDLRNLIWLSDEAHREIHKLYKEDKKSIQKELFQMIVTYTEMT